MRWERDIEEENQQVIYASFLEAIVVFGQFFFPHWFPKE